MNVKVKKDALCETPKYLPYSWPVLEAIHLAAVELNRAKE